MTVKARGQDWLETGGGAFNMSCLVANEEHRAGRGRVFAPGLPSCRLELPRRWKREPVRMSGGGPAKNLAASPADGLGKTWPKLGRGPAPIAGGVAARPSGSLRQLAAALTCLQEASERGLSF